MKVSQISPGDAVQVYGQGPVGVVVSERREQAWTERNSGRTHHHDVFDVLMGGKVATMAEFILARCDETWDGGGAVQRKYKE